MSYVTGFVTVCEAFIRMEPHVDSFWRVFSERALSERKTLGTAPMGGFTLAAAQVGQFIKFDEISSSHGSHTSAVASLPKSCLDCMRMLGAPCCSTEHLWVRRPCGTHCTRQSQGSETGRVLEVPVALTEV